MSTLRIGTVRHGYWIIPKDDLPLKKGEQDLLVTAGIRLDAIIGFMEDHDALSLLDAGREDRSVMIVINGASRDDFFAALDEKARQDRIGVTT